MIEITLLKGNLCQIFGIVCLKRKKACYYRPSKELGNGKYSIVGNNLGIIYTVIRLSLLNNCHHHTGFTRVRW
jgi:hypothetical protein